MKKYWPVLIAGIVLSAGGVALLRNSREDAVAVRRGAAAGAGESTETHASSPSRAPSSKTAATTRRAVGAVRVYTHSGGVAVPGCVVQLFHESTGRLLETVTDAAGTVEVPNLEVGAWQVGTRQGSYVPVDRETDVQEGRTSDVNLELALGGRVVGRVVDASGAPIPGAEAFLLQDDMEMGPAFRAGCDESGAFEMDGVPLTTFGICGTADRYKPRVQSGLRLSSAGESISVELRLDLGTVVSGRVVDDLGNPVPGALLTAGNELVRAAKADEEGRFTIAGLGDESMHMSAAAANHGTVYLHDVRPNTEGLVVRLPRAGAIEGKVQGPGTSVLVARWDEYWKQDQIVATLPLHEGSGFRIANLAPGSYQIWAEGPGVASDRVAVEVRADAVAGGITLVLK